MSPRSSAHATLPYGHPYHDWIMAAKRMAQVDGSGRILKLWQPLFQRIEGAFLEHEWCEYTAAAQNAVISQAGALGRSATLEQRSPQDVDADEIIRQLKEAGGNADSASRIDPVIQEKLGSILALIPYQDHYGQNRSAYRYKAAELVEGLSLWYADEGDMRKKRNMEGKLSTLKESVENKRAHHAGTQAQHRTLLLAQLTLS
ncbi:hypothetical protein JCM10207_005874 [Rhodosporidiobolus poonsookiae]